MFELLLVFAAGLLVGWNCFPQPEFVKDLVDFVVAKFSSFFDKKED